MVNRTVTRTIEADVEPGVIYHALGNAFLIPKWAPVFADSIKHSHGATFHVTKSSETFNMDLVANESSLTVDYLREMAGGVRAGAYIRVVPRVLGGSVVTMTVPVGPNTSPAQVAEVLEQELEALIKLV